MNRILKINNTAILNFADLQKEFSPWELYKVLPEFQRFARVHCVPLPLRLLHTEGKGKDEILSYRAEYLDKLFWSGILQKLDWKKPESAEVCLEEALNQVYVEKAGIQKADGEIVYGKDAETIKAQIEQEAKDAKLQEKLWQITESAGLSSQIDGGKIAMLLLAICEIAEMDATKLDFMNGAEEIMTARESDGVFDFPEADHVPLSAGKRVYRYWKYEESKLKEGTKIKTICVTAKAGKQNAGAVVIELYRESDHSLSETIILDAGTFRYCNVAEGKVIKFLPLECAGDTLKLTLKNTEHPELIVLPDGTEPWKLDAKDMTGFASDKKENGFLFIKNGKVNRAFYKTINAYMTEIRMAMILEPLVEVRIKNGKYELLTEDGQILSDGPRDGMRSCVDLERMEVSNGEE